MGRGHSENDRHRAGVVLRNLIQLVGDHVRECLHEAAWPVDRETDRGVAGQAKMNALRILGPAMDSSVLDAELSQRIAVRVQGRRVDARSGGVPIGVDAN